MSVEMEGAVNLFGLEKISGGLINGARHFFGEGLARMVGGF